jgi:hypothetical protein
MYISPSISRGECELLTPPFMRGSLGLTCPENSPWLTTESGFWLMMVFVWRYRSQEFNGRLVIFFRCFVVCDVVSNTQLAATTELIWQCHTFDVK